MADLVSELHFQLINLRYVCVGFYGHDVWPIYKLISVPLRLLLRGSSGDPPLLTQVIPNAALKPLHVKPDATIKPEHMKLPADVSFVNLRLRAGCNVKFLSVAGGAIQNTKVHGLFDDKATPIPLADWMAQPFLRTDWTLDSFITTVAHKDGGVHVEPNHDQLKAMEAWGSFHWHLTARIGDSVLAQLAEQLQRAHPQHQTVIP